nr:MAG TPA: hypothetical protein [Caudoviricetes sp.]
MRRCGRPFRRGGHRWAAQRVRLRAAGAGRGGRRTAGPQQRRRGRRLSAGRGFRCSRRGCGRSC